jgi:hypothetical protein
MVPPSPPSLPPQFPAHPPSTESTEKPTGYATDRGISSARGEPQAESPFNFGALLSEYQHLRTEITLVNLHCIRLAEFVQNERALSGKACLLIQSFVQTTLIPTELPGACSYGVEVLNLLRQHPQSDECQALRDLQSFDLYLLRLPTTGSIPSPLRSVHHLLQLFYHCTKLFYLLRDSPDIINHYRRGLLNVPCKVQPLSRTRQQRLPDRVDLTVIPRCLAQLLPQNSQELELLQLQFLNAPFLCGSLPAQGAGGTGLWDTQAKTGLFETQV